MPKPRTPSSSGSSGFPWKGIFMGLTLPATVLLVVFARQMTKAHHVANADSGVPLEVSKRVIPVVRAKPRLSLDNSTVTFNASNPYGRVQLKPSKNSISINRTVVPAWDLREIKATSKALKVKGTNASAKATPPPPPMVKPKKVFATSLNQGFMPGEMVGPVGGTPVSAYKRLSKLGHDKCVVIVGFYNSEDVVKSSELAAVWNEFHDAERGKFQFGLCDAHTPGGLETALKTGVYPDGSKPSVGLPAVLAFPTRDALNETVVVLRGTSGKRSKNAVALAKTVFNMVENLQLTLSKDGCYTKQKDMIADKIKLADSIKDPAGKAAKSTTKPRPPRTPKEVPQPTSPSVPQPVVNGTAQAAA